MSRNIHVKEIQNVQRNICTLSVTNFLFFIYILIYILIFSLIDYIFLVFGQHRSGSTQRY